MTLRLAAAERYQVPAVDPVGRALWSLDVDDDRGLWLDHHNRSYCTFNGNFDVADVPLAPFPLLSLPALLLGRLPAEPTAAPQVKGSELDLSRRPGAALDGAAPRRRGRELDAVGRGTAGGALGAARRLGDPLRPRARGPGALEGGPAEKLHKALAALAVPPGFEEEDCQASARPGE